MREKKKPRVQQRSPENTTVAFSCSKKFLAQIDEAARQERRTRSNWIDDLSTVWRTIEQTHPHLSANPWPRVRPQVTDGETGKPFTRTQEKAVFAAAERAGKGWPLACLLARHTGLRYSSVARLKWDEVDLDVGVIRHTPPKTSRHKIRVTLPRRCSRRQ
jgi:integrase